MHLVFLDFVLLYLVITFSHVFHLPLLPNVS